MEPTLPSPEATPLPKPAETQPDSGAQGETAPAPQEVLAPKGDRPSAPAPDPAASTVSLPQPMAPAPPPVAASPTDVNSASAGAPVIADDVDVIEKEWVNKAKSIVHEYKHDPYNQEVEAGRLKTDYKQKRFGKELKPSE